MLAHRPLYTAVHEFLYLRSGELPLSPLARLFGVPPLGRDTEQAHHGAMAERAVVAALDALGPNWTVLHGVSADPGLPTVEHLLVGPPGVFAIGIHNHRGGKVWVGERTMIVDGEAKPDLAVAQAQRRAVEERMSRATGSSTTVVPCLLIVAPLELEARKRPRGTEVLPVAELRAWLAELPRLHSQATVDRCAAAAADPATWATSSSHDSTADLADLAEFASIDAELTRSRRRRLAWAVSGAVLTQAAAIVMYASVLAESLAGG